MFFNVPEVREFLIMYWLVYTLRKPRKRIGSDLGVYGSRYKYEKIGKIYIEPVKEKVEYYTQLMPFVVQSGLFPKDRDIFSNYNEIIRLALGRIHVEKSKEWLMLAQKMSGKELNLYKVTLTELISARDKKDTYQQMDDRLKRINEAGKKLTESTTQSL